MQTARIAIIGAGLSGLYAAWLLERRGIRDYVLLEARDTLGGRIASVAGPGEASADAGFTADAIDRFDLGPTWFWPEYQHELRLLVDAFGLEQFEQFETGDMMVERSPDEPPVRMRGYVNSPASMRLIGGMSSLVDCLRRTLDPQRVITGRSVNRMRIVDGDVELDSEDASGGFTTWRVTQVLLALPPRLAGNTIAFEPELPPMQARQWRADGDLDGSPRKVHRDLRYPVLARSGTLRRSPQRARAVGRNSRRLDAWRQRGTVRLLRRARPGSPKRIPRRARNPSVRPARKPTDHAPRLGDFRSLLHVR